jgi:hypothetical protein
MMQLRGRNEDIFNKKRWNANKLKECLCYFQYFIQLNGPCRLNIDAQVLLNLAVFRQASRGFN